jgi:hypothetical protein
MGYEPVYEVFKVVYAAVLIIMIAWMWAVLAVYHPLIGLGLLATLMLAGGVYIIRREGWLTGGKE